MMKIKLSLLFLMAVLILQAQDVTLPLDLRQHNLTDSNSSIFNPSFSANQDIAHSLSVWTRWQWQMIDGDPTTFFVNYTGKLNAATAVGAGFFQHNTGVFLNTGAVLNFAHTLEIDSRTRLTFGLNLFGFSQELADNRFLPDPQLQLPQLQTQNNFILQLAPGIQFYYDRFSLGLTSENMFDYNVTASERYSTSGDRMYLGTMGYDFPVTIFKSDDSSVLRPLIYIKSMPGFDTQVGLSTLLSTNRFWAQAGYNNFYGISVGGGRRFFEKFSMGVLVEFGTTPDLKGSDPSFEFVGTYNFGTVVPKKKRIKVKPDEEEEIIEEIATSEDDGDALTKSEALAANKAAKEQERAARKRTRDSLTLVKKQEALAVKQQREERRRTDSINRVKKTEAVALERRISRQQRLDSIAEIKKNTELADAQRRQEQTRRDSIKKTQEADALAEAQRIRQQRIKDSLAENALALAKAAAEKEKIEQIAQQAEEEKPKAGERYEEVVGEDGLEPGYYLIANVFGTKRYFDAFMADLTKKGLEPKSFFRSMNKYNYVYLKKYNTMNEARRERDNNFNGKYPDNTWIYRVVAK